MSLKRLFPCLLALALLLALGATAQAGEAHIHFLVAPPSPAEGMSNLQALEGFRQELVDLAGGYTEWGPTQGASRDGSNLMRQTNFSYIVAAGSDLTPDLVKLIKKYFVVPQPFVLHWVGTSSIPMFKLAP